MATTLLASNPWADDFSALAAPWVASAPGAGGSSVAAVSGKLRLYIPSGGDFRWTSGVNLAPRAVLPLFTAGDPASLNDFVVQFKVAAATISGTGLAAAAGGIALLKASDPSTVVPIIEVGGTSAEQRIYHSWDGLGMGHVCAVSSSTFPLWVKLVRTDGVVYAMVRMSEDGPWISIATLAAQGYLARETPDASPDVSFDAIALYARGDYAGGSGITFDVQDFSVACWPYRAKPVAVSNLRARTELDGEAVYLSWVNPQGEDAPRYVSIWRSRYGHPEYKRPPFVGTPPEGLGFGALGEEIYAGVPVEEFLDEAVNPDRFYYYTVFATRAPVPPTFSDSTVAAYDAHPCDTDWGPQAVATNKVTGWAQRDIVVEEPLATYLRFPETVRELDQADARARNDTCTTGYLERFADFLQHAEAHHRGLIQGFGYINDPAQAPLGLVGKAADQTSIVDSFLTALNLSNLARLDAITKRRLWEGLLAAYKKKGSIPGVREFVTLLTGWRGHTLEEPGLGATLHGLKTWDGFATREEFTIAGGLTFSAGHVGGFTGLTPGKYKGGIYVDFFGNKKFITDNTATTLTLADTDWVGMNEIAFTGTVSDGGAAIKITAGWPFTKSAGDCSYNGAVLAGSKTGAFVHVDVSATEYAADGSQLSVAAGSFADGAGQSFALGYGYSGSTFAGRVLTARCWLYTGEPSWLYNPKSDLSLVGTLGDPFYRLWAGTDVTGLGAKLPTGVTDFIVWAPTGAAKYPLLITASLVDTTVHQVCIQDGPTRPNVQVGDWINPNRAQEQWFRISQIDDSTSLVKYRVDPSPDGLVPSDVALAGDAAVIATRTTMENDGILRFFLPVILSYDVTLFVLYT